MKIRALALTLVLTALAVTPLAAMGRAEGSIQKTWDYPDGLQNLVIDTDRQDVILRAGGPNVTGRLIGNSDDVVKLDRSGDTLTITARTDRSWFTWRQKSSRIEMTLPEGLNLTVTTASGSVLVQVTTGGLLVRTASGDIEALRGGTSADLDSASGDLRLKGYSGPVKASALSGDVTLEDVEGDLQVAVLSGDLRALNIAPADKSRLTSVSGDADVELRGGSAAYSVHVESVSGGLEVGEARGENELTVGTGPAVTVKSVSGDVRIR